MRPSPSNVKKRCAWAASSSLETSYHDSEWGVPSRDDVHLFELLTLEGAQAGLSWSTILAKRDGYREAFAGFDAQQVADFSPQLINTLLGNPAIVRHKGKITSTIVNAKAILKVQDQYGSFSRFLWQFVENTPVINNRSHQDDVPNLSAASTEMSKALKQRGFRFVGPITCYSLMQASGMVNDHLVSCFRHREVNSCA